MSLVFDLVGTGPPVVLLHGGMSNRRVFGYQLLGLGRFARVVAIDLPGYGASSWDPDREWLDQATAGVSEVISMTCDSPPLVVGWSLGSVVARHVVDRNGGQLVLVGARSEPVERANLEQMARLMSRDYPRLARSMVRQFTATAGSETEEWLWLLAMSVPADVAIASLLEANAEDAHFSAGDAVVVHGTHDLVVPVEDRPTGREEFVFSRSGHAPFLDEKDEFEALLRRLLRLPAA
jgi:pimeloyl-ACP methyl ester carboxylesterase